MKKGESMNCYPRVAASSEFFKVFHPRFRRGRVFNKRNEMRRKFTCTICVGLTFLISGIWLTYAHRIEQRKVTNVHVIRGFNSYVSCCWWFRRNCSCIFKEGSEDEKGALKSTTTGSIACDIFLSRNVHQWWHWNH